MMEERYTERIKSLETLVDQYHKSFDQCKQQSYNETQVRVDFVNPLFELLGWDVLNQEGLPQHLREVTHEANVTVEEEGKRKNKKPDYAFRIGTDILFFLETKKPSVDITSDRLPAFQLRRYGWSGNLKISILTNFTDLYIYDCGVRPVEKDDIGVALLAHYHYTEYANKFDEIYGMLSKESAISGEFEKRFDAISTPYRREPFDEYFLKQIQNWRLLIGNDIINNTPTISIDALNIAVQRILNRIIFLRICEDRSFEDYETLKQVHNFSALKALFLASDKKYDSGLFDLLEEDNIIVSDNILIQIFKDLYYPNNSYEFSIVDPYIIGQIYEIFLDESLIYQEGKGVFDVEKPEAVDSQGAVNTPKNITDIIVEKTLNPIIQGKSISEIPNIRIADICCGAGNFLLSSFEYIVNYYITYYLDHDKEDAIRRGDILLEPGNSQYKLAFEKRRSILLNNICGVDIDPLAVEVTRFSLLLKVLEGASLDEVVAFTRKTGEHILPNLNNNIKNGNSLVDSQFTKYDSQIYRNVTLLYSLKMFDWNQEFNGKFDAIVGNPPYIRVQNMVKYSPEEYNFYRSNTSGYAVGKAELLDKYQLFIERGLSLLKANGRLGYIIPHKFMITKSGRIIRRLLSENKCVNQIYHFGTNQVFRNRSTYTAIMLLEKTPQKHFEIAFVDDLGEFESSREALMEEYPSDYLSEKPWVFLNKKITDKLEALGDRVVPLKDVTEIFVGLQTSADKIYIIKPDGEDLDYVYFTDTNGEKHKAEKGILRKNIYDIQLTKYKKIEANTYIIYPYKKINNRISLYSVEEMKTQFPFAYDYLCQNRAELDKRNMHARTDDTWFAYGRSQSIRRFFEGAHLIWPVLSQESNYVYDEDAITFTGGGNGPFYGLEIKKNVELSIFYIQALLNHWLLEEIVKNKASSFRGDYYSHGKQFIAELPIYKIDFSDEQQKEVHDKIVDDVKLIMELSERQSTASQHSESETLRRAKIEIQNEMNSLIDHLYGVEAQEGEEFNES